MTISKRLRDDGSCRVSVNDFIGKELARKTFSGERDADKAITLITAALRQHACPKPAIITHYH